MKVKKRSLEQAENRDLLVSYFQPFNYYSAYFFVSAVVNFTKFKSSREYVYDSAMSEVVSFHFKIGSFQFPRRGYCSAYHYKSYVSPVSCAQEWIEK